MTKTQKALRESLARLAEEGRKLQDLREAFELDGGSIPLEDAITALRRTRQTIRLMDLGDE